MKRETLSRRDFFKIIGITAAIPTSLLTAKTILPEPIHQVMQTDQAFDGPLTEDMLIEAMGKPPQHVPILECADSFDFTETKPLKPYYDYDVSWMQIDLQIILRRIPQYRYIRANHGCAVGVRNPIGEPGGFIQMKAGEIIDLGPRAVSSL